MDGAGPFDWLDHGDAARFAAPGDPAAIRAQIRDEEGVDIIIRHDAMTPMLFVADMDSTMIGQECIDELADYAGVKESVAAITERAMRGELDFEAALAGRVELLKGLDEAVLADCLRTRIRENPGAQTLLATLKAKGVTTALVSGGFTDFVQPIAARLGFDHYHANVLERDGAGKLTGRTTGAIVDARAKREFAQGLLALKGWISADMIAIGDGANDLEMVKLAGLGVAYHAKPALAEAADAVIRYHGLDALLWGLGWPRDQWISSP